MREALRFGLVCIACCCGAATVSAQEIEPRAYSNIPVGVNFLVAGYGHAEGGLVFDPSIPLENAHLKTDAVLMAFARSIEVRGRSAKLDVIVPYSWISGTAEYLGQPTDRRVSGFGDARMRFSINLLGAPALTLAQFGSYRQDMILGVSMQVAAPVGQYDEERLVNIGTNRWSIKPEIGLSKATGPWTFELTAAVTLFADNDEFLGSTTREQEPVYSVQGGVVYGFPRGIWIAVSGTYYTGGQTSVDGDEGDTLQKNSLAGVTIALPIDRLNSIRFNASTGLATRVGSDTDVFNIAWQRRWGGGL